MRKEPSKMLEKSQEWQIFYKGLTSEDRNLVNVSAGGGLIEKTYGKVRDLFIRIANNGSNGVTERSVPLRGIVAATKAFKFNPHQ